MENNIAILIIFFNKLSQTISCIESFIPSKQNIYILNNASDPNAWADLQRQYINNNNIFFYNSNINIGPACGRNLLLEKCKEEWVFIVDNDICIKPQNDWKQLFEAHVLKTPIAKIFAPRIFNVHENAYSSKHKFVVRNKVVYMEDAIEKTTNYFSCCAIIINRLVFEKYGNFDKELFAFEDYEFSIRAMLSEAGNVEVFSLDDIEVIHDHQFQRKKQDKKAVLERYNEARIQKSMTRMANKHGITFEHEWRWWTKKQISDMNGKTFFEKIKSKVLAFLKAN
jgi:GT2 family glycosyltransferase